MQKNVHYYVPFHDIVYNLQEIIYVNAFNFRS